MASSGLYGEATPSPSRSRPQTAQVSGMNWAIPSAPRGDSIRVESRFLIDLRGEQLGVSSGHSLAAARIDLRYSPGNRALELPGTPASTAVVASNPTMRRTRSS